jgi:hypothetical protein
MGMFDYLKCDYKLPIDGVENEVWQTKSTPAQFLDNYEIRRVGTLWHEEYDIEDRSDPNATGLMRFKGSLTKVNKRWVYEEKFTGEIVFYTIKDNKFINVSAYFHNGTLKELHVLNNE